MTKVCSKCSVEKLLDDFYKGTGTLGVKAACKPCHNAYTLARQATPEGRHLLFVKKLKYRYGISEQQHNWLLEQQDHKCYLCGEPERVTHHKTGEIMRLAVDHDHRCCPGTKKLCGQCIRGLLCYNCNRFMGQVDNSLRLSMRFRDYQDRRPLNPRCSECSSVSYQRAPQFGQPFFECSRGHKWMQPQNYVAEFREDLRVDVY